MKKPNLSTVKKKTDKYWSLYIRYRDAKYQNGEWVASCITCEVEKPIKQMQCGHFQTRSKHSIRWDEFNTAAQCVGCNMFKQGEQYKFAQALADRYGQDTVDDVILRGNQTRKWKVHELEEVIKDCKEYIKHCESNPDNYA